MSFDRLRHLREREVKVREKRELLSGKSGKKVDHQAINIPNTDDNLSARDVDTQVELYKTLDLLLNQVGENTEHIKMKMLEDAEQSDQARRQAISNQVTKHINAITQNAKDIKEMFVQIKQDNDDFLAKPENKGSARAQIRENLYAVHVRRFQDCMIGFTQVREQYRQQTQSRIKRSLQALDPTIDDEKAEELAVSGEYANVMQEALASDNLLSTVDELRDRNRALLQLQKSVESLYQMFKDLYTLVELQGESINIIETRINNAVNYTEKGKQELEKAIEYHDKSRKCSCTILFVLLIILAVMAVPFVIKKA